ncbi:MULTISPECIES: NUDIX domain-containing protein [unclassified Streptomyces]|uniref:NUDIX domain-containing protein n=1 Tax=unclassified Streptomyces TaxID=2593676 RepID=UPI00093FC05B|nr:NUDIX domain-containing protein [Streptomyces sp. CB02058]OKI92410.1 DNA mismatch repair protein MutT [Streptomyces sp. CB02058]
MSAVKRSAGILLFRIAARADGGRDTEVLIGHMGGPLWAHRETAAWSVPKGEQDPGEEPSATARREFEEELGLALPDGAWVPLGEARQSGGKIVTVWAVEASLDPAEAVPGTFTMEWPRGSGVRQEFPEMDRFAWCTPDEALERLVTGQRVFVERLLAYVREGRAPSQA